MIDKIGGKPATAIYVPLQAFIVHPKMIGDNFLTGSVVARNTTGYRLFC